jgi:hypothetical protein
VSVTEVESLVRLFRDQVPLTAAIPIHSTSRIALRRFSLNNVIESISGSNHIPRTIRFGRKINVAFRSAKVAAFAERKATNPEVILRLLLSQYTPPPTPLAIIPPSPLPDALQAAFDATAACGCAGVPPGHHAEHGRRHFTADHAPHGARAELQRTFCDSCT